MKPYYTNLFQHVELGPREWQLVKPFGFVSSRGELAVMPPCRKWNGATIPEVVRWLYPPNGSYLKASCVHDEIVDEGEKEYADRRTTITIRTNTVTNPRPGDTVTIDSQTWNVVETSGQTFNEGFAHLNIIRQARTRIGGPGMKLARPAGGQAPFARKRV